MIPRFVEFLQIICFLNTQLIIHLRAGDIRSFSIISTLYEWSRRIDTFRKRRIVVCASAIERSAVRWRPRAVATDIRSIRIALALGHHIHNQEQMSWQSRRISNQVSINVLLSYSIMSHHLN